MGRKKGKKRMRVRKQTITLVECHHFVIPEEEDSKDSSEEDTKNFTEEDTKNSTEASGTVRESLGNSLEKLGAVATVKSFTNAPTEDIIQALLHNQGDIVRAILELTVMRKSPPPSERNKY